MQGVCYIFGAGEVSRVPAITPDDLIVGADGGLASIESLGFHADLAVGDFDSLGYKSQRAEVVAYPSEKDETDMLLAVNHALARGYQTIVMLGGMGGRLDHTLANIQTLLYIARRRAAGYLWDGLTALTAVTDGQLELPGEEGGLLSVFCTGGMAKGVTLGGVKYPLDRAQLSCDYPLGVSNRFLGGTARIAVRRGALIVLWDARTLDAAAIKRSAV